ncbi:MAG: glycosyl transferase family 2 [Haloferacaceae archaeon]
MEYVQERVTTLHDLRGATPAAPTDRAAVVVPMTEREYAGLAAERVLSELASVDPARVVVPLSAPVDRVDAFRDWLASFDLPLTVVWCGGPRLTALLDEAGLDGARGKGHDVWLGLGVALAGDAEFVVVHDADARSFRGSHVARLLFPLARDYAFVKGYYARVENDQLYGRLCRLFYEPLVAALREGHDARAAPILDYLDAFRYALAGEFAVTADLAARLRTPRSWGLELGTLGDAFDAAGFEGTAQVDLGIHEHDHRAVGGPTGLSDMSEHVGEALFRVVERHGVEPAYDRLRERYRETARRFVRAYGADAAFNGLTHDRAAELDQVDSYATAVAPPEGGDDRLPAWRDAPVEPAAVREAAAADREEASE